MMEWQKKGLVWGGDDNHNLSLAGAMVPTPFLVNDDLLRVFFTRTDPSGRGFVVSMDLQASNPSEVIRPPGDPLLGPGDPGRFDDTGVMCTSVFRDFDGTLVMTYSGFEGLQKIRYRIFTGLARSQDEGATFTKLSETPMLDRIQGEALFRGGAFGLVEDGKYRIWYVGGGSWVNISGKQAPVYDIKTIQLENLRIVPQGSTTVLALDPIKDEHGFGRPWIVKKDKNLYQLFYSIRSRSSGRYSLGYAESEDGLIWVRKDDQMNLGHGEFDFESQAICYSAVIEVAGRIYCFYNGDDYGATGIGWAELCH